MKDKHNIEIEDISEFCLERSRNFFSWEDITFQEVQEKVLGDQNEDEIHRFCGVIRTGSPFKLNEYFYRIKSN